MHDKLKNLTHEPETLVKRLNEEPKQDQSDEMDLQIKELQRKIDEHKLIINTNQQDLETVKKKMNNTNIDNQLPNDALKDEMDAISAKLAEIKKSTEIINESVVVLTDSQEKCINRVENLEISDRDHVVIVEGINISPEKSLLVNAVDALNKFSDINLFYKVFLQ